MDLYHWAGLIKLTNSTFTNFIAMAKKTEKKAPAKETKKEAKKAPVAKAEKKAPMTAEEKAAKREARREALKNRPAGQRCNSKQIDIIDLGNGQKVMTFGYPVVAKRNHIGVLVTSVVLDAEGNAVGLANNFVAGNLTIKAKKGHGVITAPKAKGEKDADDEADDADEAEEDDED